MKLKYIEGRGYETYNCSELKKEDKEEAKVDEGTKEEEEGPVFLVTHVNDILHHFSLVEVYINNQHFQMDPMRTSHTLPTISRELALN